MKFIPRIIAVLALLISSLAWVPSLAIANAVPPVLSAADAERYRAIFALQDTGQWKKADELIKALTNNILIGHVKFQRYMHPTKYQASYEELHLWMKAYYDHPEAHRLYRLAKSRRLKGWKPLPEPLHGRYLGGTGPGQPIFLSRPYKSERKRSAQTRNDVAHAKRVVSRYLYRGQPTNAAEYISQKKIRNLLDQVELDLLREKIAKSYFLYARDGKAIEFAEAALDKSRKNVPLANWTAGLAAWRLGKIEKAAQHFAALAETSRISDWNFTAANWWASRAYLKLGEPEKAYYYLEKTASQPRTFYGLLALRQLGVEKPFSWDLPTLEPENIAWLMKIPSAKRAVAAAALGHLAAEETAEYDRLFAPTVPLSRHIFKAPTNFYKTGVVFMAYLNGHQDHFTMIGGQESARSTQHLAELFRLADKAGLFADPDLAAARCAAVMSVRGVAQ